MRFREGDEVVVAVPTPWLEYPQDIRHYDLSPVGVVTKLTKSGGCWVMLPASDKPLVYTKSGDLGPHQRSKCLKIVGKIFRPHVNPANMPRT